MPKQERANGIFSLVFCVVLYLLLHDPLFALGLPAALFCASVVMGHAVNTTWLVRQDENEVVFRRPAAMRLLYAAMSIGMVWIIAHFGPLLVWNRSRHEPDGVGIFCVVVLSLFTLVFVWSSGPMDTRFDFRRATYQRCVGFPLLSRCRKGNISEIQGFRVRVGQQRILVTAFWKKDGRHEVTLGFFQTSEQAQKVAERLAACCVLPLEVR